MKKVTLLLAILFSFCAVNTAFAGMMQTSRDAWPLAGTTDAWPVAKTNDAWPVAGKNDAWPAPKVNALTKRLDRVVAEAKVSAKHKIANPDKRVVCGRCGEIITSTSQHCSATGCTDLCEPMAEIDALDPILLDQAEELVQADREAHGGYARHSWEFYYLQLKEAQAENASKNQDAQTQPKRYCIYCGKEIDKNYKPCPESNGVQACTSICPECGQDLNDPKNLVNGTHRCKFKGKYTIHPNTMKMITK